MPAHIDAGAVAYDLNTIEQCHWWTWNSKESCNFDFDTKRNETVFKSKAWKEFTNGSIVIFVGLYLTCIQNF